MISKLLLVITIIFVFVAVFKLNLFLRILAIPIVLVFAYDVFSDWWKKRKGSQKPQASEQKLTK